MCTRENWLKPLPDRDVLVGPRDVPVVAKLAVRRLLGGQVDARHVHDPFIEGQLDAALTARGFPVRGVEARGFAVDLGLVTLEVTYAALKLAQALVALTFTPRLLSPQSLQTPARRSWPQGARLSR